MQKLATLMVRLIVIGVICFIFSSEDKNTYSIIEQSSAGIIGATLGGIIAGISLIFSMLINICPQNNKHVFDDYFFKLELDLKILIFCLGASVFIPYLREIDIPLLEYPKWEFFMSRARLFTTFEILSIALSLNITLEVISSMLMVVKKALQNK
ncbi:hypothetical protein G5G86_002397 [Escherichia coli]|nr:hypothetical protein [Escherichia coli]